ncbi:DinB family protein [Eudoraea sp.]|uniref:DinB family protein n=1 Tax=Eudoraea sp. TaxID=1979955 RepID=UPI003C71D49B
MIIFSDELLQDLTTRTQRHIEQVGQWKELPLSTLIKRPSPEAWNVLECLEHLNMFGEFYLAEIERSLKKAENDFNPKFHSGILGNYFANGMLPKTKTKKIKTFKDKNPINQSLDTKVLDRFIRQQEKMLALLDKAKTKNLNKIRTSISITKWIKLKLGDTFRIVIYHNERHIEQAKKAIHSN